MSAMRGSITDSRGLARVRAMRKREKPQCAALFARVWRETFPDQPRVIDVDEFSRATQGELVLVYERDGRIIGFAGLYAQDSFLHHLYVEPMFHGQGAGRALVCAAMAHAREKISLKCQLGNARALGFYARLGFTRGEEGEDGAGRWVRLHAPSRLT